MAINTINEHIANYDSLADMTSTIAEKSNEVIGVENDILSVIDVADECDTGKLLDLSQEANGPKEDSEIQTSPLNTYNNRTATHKYLVRVTDELNYGYLFLWYNNYDDIILVDVSEEFSSSKLRFYNKSTKELYDWYAVNSYGNTTFCGGQVWGIRNDNTISGTNVTPGYTDEVAYMAESDKIFTVWKANCVVPKMKYVNGVLMDFDIKYDPDGVSRAQISSDCVNVNVTNGIDLKVSNGTGADITTASVDITNSDSTTSTLLELGITSQKTIIGPKTAGTNPASIVIDNSVGDTSVNINGDAIAFNNGAIKLGTEDISQVGDTILDAILNLYNMIQNG